MTAPHEKFTKRLKDSEKNRWVAGYFLSRAGYAIHLAPLRVAPEAGQWKGFVDAGDLSVEMRVEVKGRSRKYDFETANDWPFPDFLVMGVEAFHRGPRPFMVMHVNVAFTHVAFIYGRDEDDWAKRLHNDPEYGPNHKELTFFAKLESVHFERIPWEEL